MRHTFEDHANMTSDQRLRQIAANLSQGALRLRSSAKTGPVSSETLTIVSNTTA